MHIKFDIINICDFAHSIILHHHFATIKFLILSEMNLKWACIKRTTKIKHLFTFLFDIKCNKNIL